MALKLGDVSLRPMPATQRMVVKNQEDAYHYRWVRNEETRIEYCEALGYELAPDAKGGDPGSPDNAKRVGNLVLMRTKKDDYLARRKQIDAYTQKVMASTAEGFKGQADSAGKGLSSVDKSKLYRAPLSTIATDKE